MGTCNSSEAVMIHASEQPLSAPRILDAIVGIPPRYQRTLKLQGKNATQYHSLFTNTCRKNMVTTTKARLSAVIKAPKEDDLIDNPLFTLPAIVVGAAIEQLSLAVPTLRPVSLASDTAEISIGSLSDQHCSAPASTATGSTSGSESDDDAPPPPPPPPFNMAHLKAHTLLELKYEDSNDEVDLSIPPPPPSLPEPHEQVKAQTEECKPEWKTVECTPPERKTIPVPPKPKFVPKFAIKWAPVTDSKVTIPFNLDFIDNIPLPAPPPSYVP